VITLLTYREQRSVHVACLEFARSKSPVKAQATRPNLGKHTKASPFSRPVSCNPSCSFKQTYASESQRSCEKRILEALRETSVLFDVEIRRCT